MVDSIRDEGEDDEEDDDYYCYDIVLLDHFCGWSENSGRERRVVVCAGVELWYGEVWCCEDWLVGRIEEAGFFGF